jgi:hypothetical protein
MLPELPESWLELARIVFNQGSSNVLLLALAGLLGFITLKYLPSLIAHMGTIATGVLNIDKHMTDSKEAAEQILSGQERIGEDIVEIKKSQLNIEAVVQAIKNKIS